MEKEQLFLDYIAKRFEARSNPGQTGDEIMDNYYLCNIKREWDRVSVYINDEIIHGTKFKDTGEPMSRWDIFRNVFLARVHNKIETLEQYKVPSKNYNIIDEEIVKKQNPHAYRTQKFLQRLKDETEGWNDSCWCVGNHLEKILPDEKFEEQDWSTFTSAITSWSNVTGLTSSSFIVYQLALDLEWYFGYQDIDEHFILGPGAIRGMNMIYYLEDNIRKQLSVNTEAGEQFRVINGVIVNPIIDKTLSVEELKKKYNLLIAKENFTERIPEVDYDEDIRKLHKFINTSQWAKDNNIYIHINDIEFNLCEFNKYYSKKMGWTTTLRKYEKKA